MGQAEHGEAGGGGRDVHELLCGPGEGNWSTTVSTACSISGGGDATLSPWAVFLFTSAFQSTAHILSGRRSFRHVSS